MIMYANSLKFSTYIIKTNRQVLKVSYIKNYTCQKVEKSGIFRAFDFQTCQSTKEILLDAFEANRGINF